MKDKNWRIALMAFRTRLEGGQGLYSVQDLCDGLLHQLKLDTQQEVLAYLRDYLAVSRSHFDFHQKWKKIPNMRNIADYDKKEIAKVQELIQFLLGTNATG